MKDFFFWSMLLLISALGFDGKKKRLEWSNWLFWEIPEEAPLWGLTNRKPLV